MNIYPDEKLARIDIFTPPDMDISREWIYVCKGLVGAPAPTGKSVTSGGRRGPGAGRELAGASRPPSPPNFGCLTGAVR